MSDPTYYDILGVKPSADSSEIKTAWRQACRQTHPDTGGNPGLFALVQTAYQTLSDPAARARYDASVSSAGARRDETGVRADGHGEPRPGSEYDTADRASQPRERPDPASIRWTGDDQPLWWLEHPLPAKTVLGAWTHEWMRHVPTAGSAAVVPEPGGAWVRASVWLRRLALLGVIAVTVSFLSPGPDPNLDSLRGVLLLWAVVWLGRSRQFWPVAGPLSGACVWLGWFPFYVADEGFHWAWFAALGGGVLAGWVRWYGRRFARVDLDHVVPEDVARDGRWFGSFGSVGEVDDPAARAVSRALSKNLAALAEVPGVRVVLGASAGPGTRASHLVVCGTRVAVIDAFYWYDGDYRVDASGRVTLNGEAFRYGHAAVIDAVRAWRSLLGRKSQVRGFVAAETTGPLQPIDLSQPDVLLGSVNRVVEEAGTWLLAGDPLLVDRRVLFEVTRDLAE